MLTSIGESRSSSEGFQGAKPSSPSEHTPRSIDAPCPHPYEGVIKIAEHIGYLKHPELLKAAMSTIALTVAEFHVQTLGLSPEDAVVNMHYTRERLIDPIVKRLDDPTTRKEARNQAIWFVRSTARFFQEYFEGAPYQPVAYRGNSISSPEPQYNMWPFFNGFPHSAVFQESRCLAILHCRDSKSS